MGFLKKKYSFQRNHCICVFKDAVPYKVLLRVSWILLFCNYSVNYSLLCSLTPFDNRFVLIVQCQIYGVHL